MILMTLLSTALQEYPDLRVVLLVDDPPNPRYAGPRKLLDAAEALPAEVERLLSEPRRRFDRALRALRGARSTRPCRPTADEVHALAAEYEYAGSLDPLASATSTRCPTTTSASSPPTCSANSPPTWR